MRFFIEISYLGTNYHGWQIQPNVDTVQQKINEALSLILDASIEVVGAGRTDAGVHAKQMYAHFDYAGDVFKDKLIYRLNGYLPSDISIIDLFLVANDANCRFDAISRTYCYNINRKKDPFFEYAYFFQKEINIENMNLACEYLIGEQDFTSFSKLHTDTYTNNCNIYKACWQKQDDLIVFTIRANRFLRNMVRAIVGTLLNVGVGKLTPLEVREIILKKDRSSAGFSVPAKGLFLTDIEYNQDLINESI
jgi:tRNA pseudouridine38-40 synthase